MLPGIQKVVTKLSPERIGSLTPMLTKLNKRIACLLCCVLFLATFDSVYPVNAIAQEILKTIGQALLIIYIGFIISSIVKNAREGGKIGENVLEGRVHINHPALRAPLQGGEWARGKSHNFTPLRGGMAPH